MDYMDLAVRYTRKVIKLNHSLISDKSTKVAQNKVICACLFYFYQIFIILTDGVAVAFTNRH